MQALPRDCWKSQSRICTPVTPLLIRMHELVVKLPVGNRLPLMTWLLVATICVVWLVKLVTRGPGSVLVPTCRFALIVVRHCTVALTAGGAGGGGGGGGGGAPTSGGGTTPASQVVNRVCAILNRSYGGGGTVGSFA